MELREFSHHLVSAIVEHQDPTAPCRTVFWVSARCSFRPNTPTAVGDARCPTRHCVKRDQDAAGSAAAATASTVRARPTARASVATFASGYQDVPRAAHDKVADKQPDDTTTATT